MTARALVEYNHIRSPQRHEVLAGQGLAQDAVRDTHMVTDRPTRFIPEAKARRYPARRITRAFLPGAALCLVLDVGVRAVPPTLTEVVPKDAVAAYFVARPDLTSRSGGMASTVGLVGFLADRAQEVGLLSNVDDCSRQWIDSLASLSTVLDYAHAIALLDVQAAPRADGGHELAGLRAVLICHTHGANEPLERRIQHLLSTYTNREDTVLSQRTVRQSPVFTLRDHRLPPWLSITWGRFGEYYVVGVGDGSFERATATITDHVRSLGYDAWFQRAFARADGAQALVAWYLRFDAVTRQADAVFSEKVAGVQEALRMKDVERGLWTIGFQDRALEVSGVRRRNDVDEVTPIASRRFLAELDDRIIPDEASGYAVIDCEPRTVLKSICEADLAAGSPRTREKSRELWGRLAAGAGVSIDEDIMSQLGSPVVIHDYPHHALRLPFAWTILVRISGDPAALRDRIDRWLENARRQYAETGLLQLRHDEDGVWYIQYGLMGPALLVTDKWLIVSFSPQAVRQNLEFVVPTTPVSSGGPTEPAVSP